MAAVYGTIQGNRGIVSRLGSKSSGLRVMLKTWLTQTNITLESNDDIHVDTSSIDGKTLPKIYINNRCVFNPTNKK